MNEPILQVEGLSKSFGSLSVLRDVSLTVERGERIALIGPSGTGKSVFLRCIAMLEKPDEGHIHISGTEITTRGTDLNLIRRKMGMVYQGFHLFSHMNVMDNITFAPIKIKKMSKADAEKKAAELLEMIGLRDKTYAMPSTLSGGQKQRVAIARCLAMEPELLLMDEPTSALDPAMTAEVLAIVRKLANTGLTLMLVTHEVNFAREFASRILYLDEGGIYEQGAPEQILNAPERPKTIAFVNRLKVFEEHIKTSGFDIVGLNARVEVYFQKYELARKQMLALQLFLEELLVILFGGLYAGTTPDILLTVQYSADKKETRIDAEYTGMMFNPFDDGEDLGAMLMQRLCDSKTHEFIDGKNILTAILI